MGPGVHVCGSPRWQSMAHGRPLAAAAFGVGWAEPIALRANEFLRDGWVQRSAGGRCYARSMYMYTRGSKFFARLSIVSVNVYLKDWCVMLDREPVAISGAVKAVLGALVILGVIHWTDDQVVYVVVALEAVLGVFLRSKVTPTFKVEEKVAEAVEQKELEVTAYLATEHARQLENAHPGTRPSNPGDY